MGFLRRALQGVSPINALLLGGSKPNTGGADAAMAQAEAAQRARYQSMDRINALYGVESQLSGQSNASEAARNRALREQVYGRLGEGLRGYLTQDLNTQQQGAQRDLLFGLARRGLWGGSVAVDSQNRLLGQYERGLMDIENQRTQAIQRARAADEQSRLGFLQQLNAGVDSQSALTAANNTLMQNLRDAERTGYANQLGSWFSGLADAGTQGVRRRAKLPVTGMGGLGSPEPDYFGSVGDTGGVG